MFIATLHKTVASFLVALLLRPVNAHAQSETASGLDAQRHMTLRRLKVPLAPFDNLRVLNAPTIKGIAAPDIAQQTSPAKCRPGRRSLIGALIGAGGTLPFVSLVHTRFENEAANGTAAAATVVALGAAAGAFVGLATCGS
jgi:hypothetical protein